MSKPCLTYSGQSHRDGICQNCGFSKEAHKPVAVMTPSYHTREFVPVNMQKPEMDRVTVARLRWNGDLVITTEPDTQ